MKKILAALGDFLTSLANPVTQNQLMGQLRIALPAIGGIAVTLGWIPADVMNHGVQTALGIIGPLLIVVGSIWSLVANNKSSIIKATAGMPETQVSNDGKTIVILDPALASAAKDKATPPSA